MATSLALELVTLELGAELALVALVAVLVAVELAVAAVLEALEPPLVGI